MSPVFTTYLQMGFLHICTPQAADHLTFLLALCAPYVLADWRRVLALVTSFTVGHSLTLALATLGLVRVNPVFIEALIPVTIMVTALFNLRRAAAPAASRLLRARRPVLAAAPNALALGFGLVHGLGFANNLRRMLGSAARPVQELLAFNVGVELAQVLIVAAILLVGAVLLRGVGVARRDWLLTTSGAALGIATVLLMQQLWP